MRRSANAGFSLLELLVALAAVAILAAIAIPSYADYVRRAQLADAQKAMAASASDLEQIFADRRLYPAAAAFTPKTAGDIGVTYAPSLDQRGYVLSGTGTASMSEYYLVMNSSDLRCKCEKCATNPLSAMASSDNACPSGSIPW
jgi:type IV pilus assembly protein PilE